MIDFFKQKEQKPFAYPSIEMRKNPQGYKWIAVIILVAVILFFVLWVK